MFCCPVPAVPYKPDGFFFHQCCLMDRLFQSAPLTCSPNFHIIRDMSQAISISFLDGFGLCQVLAYKIHLFPVILEIFLERLLSKAFPCLPVSGVNSGFIKVEIHVSCCQEQQSSACPYTADSQWPDSANSTFYSQVNWFWWLIVLLCCFTL